MELSARNQLNGVVSAVHGDGVMSEIVVTIEPTEITAVITKASADRLRLIKGDRVTVIIKSTEVIIGK